MDVTNLGNYCKDLKHKSIDLAVSLKYNKKIVYTWIVALVFIRGIFELSCCNTLGLILIKKIELFRILSKKTIFCIM